MTDISQLSNVYATPYFSKKLIQLLHVTGKILTCQNLNLISLGWNTKLVMQLKSTQYLPLPRFCQKLSCKWEQSHSFIVLLWKDVFLSKNSSSENLTTQQFLCNSFIQLESCNIGLSISISIQQYKIEIKKKIKKIKKILLLFYCATLSQLK